MMVLYCMAAFPTVFPPDIILSASPKSGSVDEIRCGWTARRRPPNQDRSDTAQPKVTKMQVYNFNAGPAALPKPVMLKAQEEFVNYHGTGIGIIEESHRAKPFDEVIQAAEANVRKILGVPENYAVLFLQGGASLQFAMAPMNLMVPGKKVGVADTGVWAHKALKEIKIQKGDVDLVYDGSANGYTAIEGI